MKKIKFVALFIVLMGSSNLYSQSRSGMNSFAGGHDSLLFDDSNEMIFIQNNFDDNCYIKVSKISGFVIGTRVVRKIYTACGLDTVTTIESAATLKYGDNVVKNEEIRTGEDGFVQLELTDGSVIILGPNSSIIIDEEICGEHPLISFMRGSLWSKVKKLIGGGKFEVVEQTFGTSIGVRGTEFSVETNSERDIVKVYEGTVEVKKSMNMKSIEQSGTEMEKISKDYQEGKITQEEYISKLTEISTKMSETIDNTSKETLVEAGNMVTVTNKVTLPEPIPGGETKWFEDPRIK